MRKAWGLVAAVSACLWASGSVQAQAQAQAETPAGGGCQITTSAAPEVSQIISRYQFNFVGFAALCDRLRNAGMGVAITEAYGQISDRSYGLVEMHLYDLRTRTNGWRISTGTVLLEDLSAEGPELAMMQAIDETMAMIASDPEAHIVTVAEERVRLQNLFGGQ